jgi:hypothetical protein
MSRGPLPEKAIAAALAAARVRGVVSLCHRSRESVCDIVIHAKSVTMDVMIRRCRRLHCSLAEMERQFEEALARLRLVPEDPCRSRELWACSPYGVLRFFRVLKAGLMELDYTGRPIFTGTAAGGGCG